MKKLNRRHKNSKHSSGFTILELIVVVVIIGILAAVTIATYIGTVPSARDVSIQSDLSNASDQLVIDQAQASDHKFPIDLAHASATIKFSGGTTNTYVVDNTDTPKTFCLTATNNNQSYFITQEGKPLPGPCPVLYFDAGIQTSYPGTGTAWYDLSGNGNNGTMHGGVTYSITNGGTMSFNGTDGYVELGNNISLNPTNQITLEMWFQPNETMTTWQAVLGKGGGNSFEKGYEFAVGGGQFGFWVNGSAHFANTTMPASGEMAYWVGTFDGSNIRLYKNGSLVNITSYVSTITATTLPFRVGLVSELGGNKNYTFGKYNDVRVYNHALSDDEVNKNFSIFRSRYGI